jgi:hypothetical protein
MKNGSLRIATICLLFPAYGQSQPGLSVQEKAISTQIRQLRGLTDEVWTQTVGKIARQIQQLPAGEGKESLIGDFGESGYRGRRRPRHSSGGGVYHGAGT